MQPMKTYIATALLLGATQLVSAQGTDTNSVKKGITAIHLQVGGTSCSPIALTASELTHMYPTSSLLNHESFTILGNIISGYSSPRQPWSIASNLNLNLSFQPKRSPATLRFGAIYQSQTSAANFNHMLSSSSTFDTLTSSATGEIYLIDSIQNNSFMVSTNLTYIGLDHSLIFQTKHQRFNAYAGIGLSALVSVNAHTQINYKSSTVYNHFYATLPREEIRSIETETIKIPTSVQGRLYIPIGLDLKLGKQDNLIGNTSLHVEWRPTLLIQKLPTLSTNLSFASTSLIGLTYKL
jgi:hypothetical protein